MPENEFEKQVQQKMKDFKPSPSATVWEKIEAEIRQKRRRRILFFFLLPALMLTGLGIYFGYYHTTSTDHLAIQQKKSAATPAPQPSSTVPDVHADQHRPFIPSNPAANQAKIAPLTNGRSVDPGETSVSTTASPPSTTYRRQKKSGNFANAADSAAASVVINPAPAPGREAVLEVEDEQPAVMRRAKEEKSVAVPTSGSLASTDSLSSTVTGPSTLTPATSDTERIKSEATVEKMADSAQATTQSKQKSSKPWRWGLEAGFGKTANYDQAFSLQQEKSLSSQQYNSPGNSTGGPLTGNTNFYPPSAISGGGSWKIGLYMERKLGRRSSISLGLQYQRMNDHRLAGSQRDSSVNLTNQLADQTNRFYTGNPSNRYNNNYHFAGLPLRYSMQLNKGKKWLLEGNMGLTPAWLVSTNAVVYDTSLQGIYYRRPGAFNRLHLMAGAGLDIGILSRKSVKWMIGPELSFDLRRLVNNPFDRKQYLFFGGIHLRMLLPEKKKTGDATQK